MCIENMILKRMGYAYMFDLARLLHDLRHSQLEHVKFSAQRCIESFGSSLLDEARVIVCATAFLSKYVRHKDRDETIGQIFLTIDDAITHFGLNLDEWEKETKSLSLDIKWEGRGKFGVVWRQTRSLMQQAVGQPGIIHVPTHDTTSGSIHSKFLSRLSSPV